MAHSLGILIVDDEQIVLDSVRKLLRKEDYRLFTALSAREGLTIFDAEDIGIVLTDLMMPEIDGLEFMKLIKEKNANIPVIMITGYATISTALQATQLGAFDYVAKPFSRKELQSVVRRAAELARVPDSTDQAGNEQSEGSSRQLTPFKTVGDNCWMMRQKDGNVLLGVEHSFLSALGKIQTVHLPAKGDELRQGGVYVQIFSTDLRSHTVLSPLTGVVVEVNQKVQENPELAFQDPFGDGWLIRLKPTRYERELKELGL